MVIVNGIETLNVRGFTAAVNEKFVFITTVSTCCEQWQFYEAGLNPSLAPDGV